MSAAGGGIRLTIGGSAEQLQMAAQQGASALGDLAAAYRQQAEIINTTAEAYRMLGAAAAANYEAMLRGATGSEQYDAALSAVRAQLGLVAAEQNRANASMADFDGLVTRLQGMGGPVHSLGNLLGGFSPMLKDISAGTANFGSVAENVSMGALGMLSGGFGALTASVGSFMQQAWAMTVGMVMFQGFTWAAQQVHSLADEMMNLNETMQNQYVGWAYLFGGPGNGPGGASGPNYGAASQLMQWTAVQSYNAPFTRQDINQAISTLQTVGLDQAGIERYLPVLEDLAVRNPGLSLAQIAQSVMGAEFGYTRMLRYDLRIAPQELEKYGLNMSDGTRIDPSTLLPALLNYARDQGYYSPTGPGGQDQGAAYMLAHNTFQGAWTSFQDRYQNLLLELGGTLWNDQTNPNYDPNAATHTGNAVSAAAANKFVADLEEQIAKEVGTTQQATDQQKLQDYLNQFGGGISVRNPNYDPNSSNPLQQQQYIMRAFGMAGDIRQGSLFDMLIQGLNSLTTWWDQHQGELTKLADLISQGLGAGFHMAANALQGFLDGLAHSGLGTSALEMVQNAVKWLADPEHQQQIRNLASALGTGLGTVLQSLAYDAHLVTTEMGQFMQTLTGDSQATFIDFLYSCEQSFIVMSLLIQDLITGLVGLARWVIDIAKALYDLRNGDLAAAGADLADMEKTYIQTSAQMNANWANALAEMQAVLNAQAAYDKGQSTGWSTPQTGGSKQTPPDGHRTAGQGSQSYALGAGFTAGSGTTYGPTTINNFIYGADTRTVQAVVDQSKQRQALNGDLLSKRPGIGRFHMVGLVY